MAIPTDTQIDTAFRLAGVQGGSPYISNTNVSKDTAMASIIETERNAMAVILVKDIVLLMAKRLSDDDSLVYFLAAEIASYLYNCGYLTDGNMSNELSKSVGDISVSNDTEMTRRATKQHIRQLRQLGRLARD